MATQLSVINDALDILGETNIVASELANLSNKPARVMSSGWPQAVDECLSAAPWVFASRIAEIPVYMADDPNPQSFAAPGFWRAFQIPDDHLRTNWLRATADRASQPIQFHVQDGFWHTGSTSLIASYVSHEFRPPETWTPLFAKAVAGNLAWSKRAAIRPQADEMEIRQKASALMDQARTTDASEMPFSRHAPGRLVRSRGGDFARNGRTSWGYGW